MTDAEQSEPVPMEADPAPVCAKVYRARVTLLGREPDVVEFEECPVQKQHDAAVQAYLDKHGLMIIPFMPTVELL